MGFSDSHAAKLRAAGRFLGIALIYAVVGKLGVSLSHGSSLTPFVRPSAGVALAVLLLGGTRLWPAIALGALAVSVFAGHMPPLVACGVAAAHTLEAVAGAVALRRALGLRNTLERFQDVVSLAVIGGLAAPALGATLTVASFALGGLVAPGALATTWIIWWTADLVGVLVIAPALLTVAAAPVSRPRPAHFVERAALGLALIGCALVVFTRAPTDLPSYPIFRPYLLFLPLIWAALRFEIHGAATGMLLVALVAVWGTSTGRGAFVRESPLDSGLSMRVFLAATSMTTLALGAVVSEREKSRKRLNDSESLLRSVLDGTNDAVYVKDLHGRYMIMNPAGARLLGQTAEMIIGKDDVDLFTAQEASVLAALDREVLDSRCPQESDEHLKLGGQVRVYHTTKAPFLDHEGKLLGVIGISRDITARRRAEHEIAELHQRSRVANELRELQERQRVEVAALLVREQSARAEAQAATTAKDEFLAVLSHELRTPLQSMLGWTQMLRANRLDTRAAERGLETIERNVRTQAHLIEDLLDISRIVAGTIRVDRQPFDLRPLVASTLSSATSAAAARSIRLDAMLDLDRDRAIDHGSDPVPVPVSGDRDRLEQVISNLVGNAVKFTPHGGSVTVRLEVEDGAARIVVEDSGCGISPDFLPHVFERFRQAESTTRRSHGGLGIGLSIVRHLVELHDGTVTAASPGEGRGATFVVTLPLTGEAREAESTRDAPDTLLPAATTTALIGARVLVVDDDADTCELLAAVLGDAGAEVRTASSARDARHEIASFFPDLVLSDIGMPGEDGYAFIRQLRAREAALGGHLPAIALTAFASRADREQALALGFEEHLAKPVSPADLTRAAARVLRHAT